jgi:hypothetical protein
MSLVEVEDDFDKEFYEIVLPEAKAYYERSTYSKREKYYIILNTLNTGFQ